MSIHYGTFIIAMPHEELGAGDEEFDCTFEYRRGCPQTDVDPGDPDEISLIEAYASISGPVNRVNFIQENEVCRIEEAMLQQLAKDSDPDFTELDGD